MVFEESIQGTILMEGYAHTFPNFGYLSCKYDQEELKELRTEVYKIRDGAVKADDANGDLVGQIEREYSMDYFVPQFEPLITPLVQKYLIEFPEYADYIGGITSTSQPYFFYQDSLWVNFQKKHEYNPPHDHSGVFSFALWLDIPYDEKEEMEASYGRYSNNNTAGKFSFLYTNSLGWTSNHVIDCNSNTTNLLLLFPSKMVHSVYPFQTSDDYRITLSGNIKIGVDL